MIVATGATRVPRAPSLPGLPAFRGRVLTTLDYKHPAQLRGQRVLLVGGSFSAVEIAADLSVASPACLVIATRRMRNVIAKQGSCGVVPGDFWTSRLGGLQLKVGRADLFVKRFAQMKSKVARCEELCTPPPTVPLTCVVHGKLARGAHKPEWVVGEQVPSVDADGRVRLADGSVREFDTIVFATGFSLALPFLHADLAAPIGASAESALHNTLDLDFQTTHPELPGLFFCGLFTAGAAHPPLADSQARYIARMIADPSVVPSVETQRKGIAAMQAVRKDPLWGGMIAPHDVQDEWARRGGFEVDLAQFSEWARALLFGPWVPAQFRLCGEGLREEALMEFERQMKAAGFQKGDNAVDAETARDLREVRDRLREGGEPVMGFETAVATVLRASRVDLEVVHSSSTCDRILPRD